MLSLAAVLALAAAGAASPVFTAQDYARALKSRGDVSADDLSNFEFYVQHAGAAYCNVDVGPGDPVTCGDDVCPAVQGDGATVVDGFSGSLTGISGYVSTDHARGEVVMSIRGSNNIRNFITDVVFNWDECDLVDDCKAHAGFAKAWDEISEAATAAVSSALDENPDYKLIATGHSLGGAVATLGGAYLRRDGRACDIFTFGSPRVGNDALANFVTAQDGGEFRVTHTDDPVPRLPPITFGYRHTTPEFWLSQDADGDYPLDDILVCDGIDSVACNAGTFGLDIAAHLQYLIPVSACSPLSINKLDDTSDEELKGRLNGWSQDDQDFVNGG